MEKFKVGDRVKYTATHRVVKTGSIRTIKRIATFGNAIDLAQIFFDESGLPFLWASFKDLELVETKKEEKKMHKILIMEDSKDPKVVIARDLETHKEAKARCGDKDTYDFYTGAKIAFERLNEANKPKFKVGDCVIGNDSADQCYYVTTKGWIGYVEELSEIRPTGILVNSKKDFTGERYFVDEKHFDKCDNPPYNSRIVCTNNCGGFQKWWTVGKIYEVKNGYLVDDDGDKYGPFDNFRHINLGMMANFVEVKE